MCYTVAEVMIMNMTERFLTYVSFDTTSDETTGTCPSTENQFLLADELVRQLKEIGIENAYRADNAFVYAKLPSNLEKKTDTVGFLAHMDTSNATSGKDIKARIIENYDGEDILLSEGICTRVNDYPALKELKGKDLIVTDGKTLLGADDKAGITVIMTFIEKLVKENIPHGDILVCFTPDEEIGTGIHHIDRSVFTPDYAYTVDGGKINDVTYECFNGASAFLTFHGNSIHPGEAKDKMINALQLAMDFHGMLPVNERPEYTSGREGFNHLTDLKGNCQEAQSFYIIRNHDRTLFERQKEDFRRIAEYFNRKYGKTVISLELKDAYRNMAECFKGKEYIIEQAKDAIRECGYTATSEPIRGGTDGAQLSFMGIPTPNLGTGGMNFHGNHELLCIDDMKEMVKILLGINRRITER